MWSRKTLPQPRLTLNPNQDKWRKISRTKQKMKQGWVVVRGSLARHLHVTVF